MHVINWFEIPATDFDRACLLNPEIEASSLELPKSNSIRSIFGE
jgi:hypothetical protein